MARRIVQNLPLASARGARVCGGRAARRSSLSCAALVVFALSACGNVIHAADFDQSCVVDSDCVPVLVGEMCDCLCGTAAINKADLPKYQEAAADEACGTLCSPCEGQAEAFCDAGMCAVR